MLEKALEVLGFLLFLALMLSPAIDGLRRDKRRRDRDRIDRELIAKCHELKK